jgi:hypothetical protein
MSVMAEQEVHVCSGPCHQSLPRSAYSASVWRDGFGYCRDCRRAYNAGYGSSARQLVEELRERVGSLEKMVAELTRKVA